MISCRVEESRSHRPIRDFGVRVEIDGRYSHMITALRRERGRISFAIEKATRRRGVDLQVLFASAAQDQTAMSENRHVARFSVSRCDITPLS